MNDVLHKKVAVLGPFPPPYDGQTLATRRLARLLKGSRYEIQRVNLAKASEQYAEGKVRLRVTAAMHYLRQRRTLRARLQTFGPDVVLWTSISPTLSGHIRDLLIVSQSVDRHVRQYAVVHWGNFHGLFERPLTRHTGRALVSRLSGLVFLSPSLSAKCAPYVPAQQRIVIPNTIDDDLLCSTEEVSRKQELKSGGVGVFRLLFVGNLASSKGFMDVLSAVSALKDTNLNVRVDLVGRWEGEHQKRSTLSALGDLDLASDVYFHEEVRDRERVKAFYLEADVFVLPTYYPREAQPLVLIEAMNAATPIITTRHAGIPELVGDSGSAVFVPPQAPACIADALQQILEDRESWLEKSAAARRHFLENFSPENVQQRWHSLIDHGTVEREIE